jgi:hypothetical protein
MAATNIVNDGNTAGTNIIEATIVGDSKSAITLTNDGKLTIGNSSRAGSISLDNASLTSDGSGNVTATSVSTGNTQTGVTVTGTYGSGNTLNGNQMLASQVGTWTSTGGPETITHNFGSTPKVIYITVRGGVSFLTNKEVTSITSTSFTVSNTASGSQYTFIALG